MYTLHVEADVPDVAQPPHLGIIVHCLAEISLKATAGQDSSHFSTQCKGRVSLVNKRYGEIGLGTMLNKPLTSSCLMNVVARKRIVAV